MAHVPVMVEEVLQYLDPQPNQNFVDCTLGDGGHALAVLERTAPNGKVLGIDADAEAIAAIRHNPTFSSPYLKGRLGGVTDRLVLVNDNFRNLAAIVQEQQFGPVQGILLDLGFSSSTLERGRGFSFEKDELLDMRFDTRSGIRAAEIVNGWNQKQLAKLLEEYGEERLAREIADRIVAERKKKPIVTTKQLVDVVVEAYREKMGIRIPPPQSSPTRGEEVRRSSPPLVGGAGGGVNRKERIPWIGGIHPATRTFQALRIAVNDELGALQEVLPQAVEVLAPGGRLAVIAFHSLEDRIVKQFFNEVSVRPKGLSYIARNVAQSFSSDTDVKIKVLTKKPAVPSEEEIKNNPRARSAKLRVIERL